MGRKDIMEMAFADETDSVGRVTPCAPMRVRHSSDGAHGMMRPTSTALFVLTLGLIAIQPWPCVAADAGFNIRALTNSIGMRFVLIPAGEFMMGSTQAESDLQLKR